MRGHSCNRVVEPLDRADVPDRTEQARDHVKAPVERERRHVCKVQGDATKTFAGDRNQLFVEIETLHVVPGTELFEVLPGATRDVEKGRSARRISLDQRVDELGLHRVVLVRVDGVIDVCRTAEHETILTHARDKPRRSRANCRSGKRLASACCRRWLQTAASLPPKRCPPYALDGR